MLMRSMMSCTMIDGSFVEVSLLVPFLPSLRFFLSSVFFGQPGCPDGAGVVNFFGGGFGIVCLWWWCVDNAGRSFFFFLPLFF
jgi:hypothetical protein